MSAMPHLLFAAGRVDEAANLLDEFVAAPEYVEYGIPAESAWTWLRLGRGDELRRTPRSAALAGGSARFGHSSPAISSPPPTL